MGAKFTVLIISFVFIGCAGQEFSGSAPQRVGPSDENATLTDGQEETGITSDSDTDKPGDLGTSEVADGDEAEETEAITLEEAEDLLGTSDDDQAILGCLAEWGETNLDAQTVKGYRTLTASSTGFTGSKLKDVKKTDTPRLVLVKAASVGFSGVQMDLMNPNGWYCIKADATGFSSTKALIHCEAEVAGFEQNNVGFSGSSIDYVGC